MNKNLKKFFSILLTLSMVFSFINADIVLAEEDQAQSFIQEEVQREESSQQEEETSQPEETQQEIIDQTSDSTLPGMPDNYKLSTTQQFYKEKMVENNVVGDFDKMIEGLDYVKDEIIFIANSQQDAELIANAYNAELLSFQDNLGVAKLHKDVTVKEAVIASANIRNNLPPVSPNHIYSLNPINPKEIDKDDAMATAQVDPYITDPNSANYQWHHDAIDSFQAWKETKGSSSVKVAVLDTGFYLNHKDKPKNLTAESFVVGNTTGNDGHGHGTHVAGIIAAASDNGIGGSGIAPDVSIIAIKVLDDQGSGSDAEIIKGINRAKNLGVDIINMSLGGYFYSAAYDQAVQDAVKSGVAFVVAAGNDASNMKCYPASFNNVICVAALTEANTLSSFSNFGEWVDVAAPGSNIISTHLSDGYMSMDGTSMATPVVSGVAALVLSAKPELRKNPAALEAYLKSTTNKISSKLAGTGIVNAGNAIAKGGLVPTANVLSGNIDEGSYVKLSAGFRDKIYFTLDGKNPTVSTGIEYDFEGAHKNGIQISGKLNSKVTLKAISVSESGVVSKVMSVAYTLKRNVKEIKVYYNDALLSSSTPVEVVKGKSITLSVKLLPEDTTTKTVKWVSSDPGVTVSSSNVLTVKTTVKSNVVNLTATADGVSSAKLVVNVIDPKDAQISKLSFASSKEDIYIGGNTSNKLDLKTKLLVNGNIPYSNQKVSWSSSKSAIATVDSNGNVTALASGSTVITVCDKSDNSKKATITINVKQLVEKISLSGVEKVGSDYFVTITRGKSYKITASVEPVGSSNKSLTYKMESGKNDISVSNGTIKVGAKAPIGNKQDTVLINSADGNASAKIYVNVIESLTSAVKLNNTSYNLSSVAKTADNISLKQEIKLTATIEPATASNKLFWSSSNEKVAIVDQNGLVKQVGPGTATITAIATDGSGKKATCKINVLIPINSLTIDGYNSSDVIKLAPAKTQTLKAVVSAEKGASTKLTWVSSDESVAKVSNGKITIQKNAEINKIATITVQSTDFPEIQTSVKVMTVAGLINKITFKNPKVTLLTEKINGAECSNTIDLSKAVTVEGSTGFNNKLIWSTNKATVATVDSKGVVTAVGSGTATITATAEDGSGKKATCTVTVNKPIDSIYVPDLQWRDQANPIQLQKGKSITFKAEVTHNKASNTKVVWSMTGDTGSFSLSTSGVLKANANATSLHKVKVIATAADGSGRSYSGYVQISAKDVISSINYTSTGGLYTKTGEYKLFTTNVVTSAYDGSGYFVSNNETMADLGNRITVSFNGKVETDYQKVKTYLTWSSSNPKVVAVSNDPTTHGRITAGTPGTATITCATNDGSGKKITFKVSVLVPSSRLAITRQDRFGFYLGKGASVQLVGTVGTHYGTPTNKKILWSLDDNGKKYATISSTGKLTAKKDIDDFVPITVIAMTEDGSAFATFYIVLCPDLATYIYFGDEYYKYSSINAYEGSFGFISIRDNQSLYDYYFTSSDPEVASICWFPTLGLDQCLITTGKPGKATLTAYCGDGSGKKASITITVHPKP